MEPCTKNSLQPFAFTPDKHSNVLKTEHYATCKSMFIGLIMLTTLLLGGCSAIADDLASSGAESYTCDDLAEESVAMSAENDSGFGIELLKVRDPQILNDFRESYEIPSGTEEELIFSCKGMGVWSDGSNSEIKMKLTVDSDNEQWISYKEM